MHLCPTRNKIGAHFLSLAQSLDLGLLCCRVFLWQREGSTVKMLDVIYGITGFDRGEQTSFSVTDIQTPKMPPDSKTTAIYKLQSTPEVNWSQSPWVAAKVKLFDFGGSSFPLNWLLESKLKFKCSYWLLALAIVQCSVLILLAGCFWRLSIHFLLSAEMCWTS